ncbi:MAG: T9SS type A sorting domain-containing protein [Bacteroidia bacterium]|nr:T9SS type A sorting domain-containing protein [Bacteroidia bacterium]
MKRSITTRLFKSALFLLLLFGGETFAALSGTYTINSGGSASSTNYLSVSAAISDLVSGTRSDGGTPNGPGVSGPVNLRIISGSGPYSEQVNFTAITGASATNYIRLTGGPSMEEINFTGTTTADRHVIRLSGAKHIILDSLTIKNNDTNFGYGVWLTNSSDSNIVRNCAVTVDLNTTSSNFAGITISGASPTTLGDNGDYNLIENNVVSGGYYSITVNGQSTSIYGQGNHVIGNMMLDFYYYGLRHYYQNGGVIGGNTVIARASATASAYGMYIYRNDNFLIEKNNIQRAGTYGMYVYYGNYQNGSGTSRATIRNNMIGGDFVSTSTNYGIYLTTNARNIDVFNNSVSLFATNSRALYQTSGTGSDIRNNSFSINGSTTGYAIYVSLTSYVNTVDYNNYYAPNAATFLYLGAGYSQTNYVGGGGYNTNSTDGDPNYIDPVLNLHAFATQLYDGGDATVPVTDDYDGDVRPNPVSTIPDIGADEYLPDSVDISLKAFFAPMGGTCPDSFEVVKIILSNNGLNTKSNIPVTVTISGAGSATLNYTYPGPMVLGQTDTITVGTFNSWPGGTFNLEAVVSVPNDQTSDNDTLNATANINLTPPPPTANGTTICEGDSAWLIASSSGTAFWYDSISGGNLIQMGDTLNTGPLTSGMTYYAEARGLLNSSVTTTFANNNSCGGGNMFDVIALADVTIDSFDINISASATVDVYYKVGSYLGFETNSGAWTLLGSASVTSAGTGNPSRLVVPPLNIPAGQTYGIYIATTTIVYTTLSAGTYYNTPELSVYCGTGLCGNFSGTNFPRGWNGTVYYNAVGCASHRTPVTVGVDTKPLVNLVDSAYCGPTMLDAGNPGASYAWSTGDTTQMTTVTTSGMVDVTVTNGVCSAMDSANVTINDLPVVNLGPDLVLCDGATATLDAGNSGSTYLWSDNSTSQTLTVSSAGSYNVMVTSPANCSASDTIDVSAADSPAGTASADLSGCPTVVFSSTSTGGTATSMDWDFGDGNTGTGSGPSHTYTSNGTYTVTFTQTNDCGTDVVTQTITVDCLTGVEESIAGQVVLYPNPARDRAEIMIDLKGALTATISLTDLQGKALQTQTRAMVAGSNSVSLDLSGLSTGMYLVKINSDQFTWNAQLVKE